eukprot:349807-Amphidinium_carterae.2
MKTQNVFNCARPVCNQNIQQRRRELRGTMQEEIVMECLWKEHWVRALRGCGPGSHHTRSLYHTP